MLLDLKVSNFAIIENIQISFEEGLNILSGETGAGKSVLLKSLALLMGEKSASESVRSNADKAVIEGSFDLLERPDVLHKLEEMGFDNSESLLVVRRIISKNGKNRVYLNGSLSTLSSLRSLVAPLIEFSDHDSAPLIEMTGQHDNRNLQSKNYHLDLLDHYAGAWKKRGELSRLFRKEREIEKQILEIEENRRQRTQRLDFLEYQLEEIENMNLSIGEENELEERVKILKNSSRLLQFAGETEAKLYSSDSSIVDELHRILLKSDDLCEKDSNLESRVKGIQQAKTLLEEAAIELRDYEQNFVLTDDSLENCEERLSQLRILQKKYGQSVKDIFEARDSIVSEINDLKNSDESLSELKSLHKSITSKLQSLDRELYEVREQAATLMTQSVNDELADLNMKGVELKVSISQQELTDSGSADVEFVTRSSRSDNYRSISKFASGGELSRILLAIKVVVGQSDHPRTFLFDEVDSGVSGETADKVGRKLASISRGQQVICVTHLPQVASFAKQHFYIYKKPTDAKVNMFVKELSKKDRVSELARLLSGEKITSTSLKHAQQLLKDSVAG